MAGVAAVRTEINDHVALLDDRAQIVALVNLADDLRVREVWLRRQ